jgi:hypothetical protein
MSDIQRQVQEALDRLVESGAERDLQVARRGISNARFMGASLCWPRSCSSLSYYTAHYRS